MTKVHLKLLPVSSYVGVNRDDPIRFYTFPGLGWFYRRRVEMCLEELTGGQHVLEIGFGSGVSFFNLHELYTEIHGLDLTTDIDRVAGFFRGKGIETSLQQGDVRRMPYTDGFFDSVLMISILEHLQPEDLHQVMVEVRRVLRPGGQLVYGAPVERPLMVTAFRLLATDIRGQHFSTEKDIAHQAGESFRRVRVRQLPGPLGLFGSLYEVGHFARD
jgi:ubiquinone/menaquinone biosynthesis C-methylase UbiE